MSEAITSLIDDVERLKEEVKELKAHWPVTPLLYQEGDKVKNKLSDDEILHRAKLHNEIRERTAQRLNKGG